MATNTLYIPSGYPLDASKVIGAGMGVFAVCTALATTNLDLDITDDMILTGVEIITSGSSMGDYGVLQVVATANKSVVVATPVPGPWYVSQNEDTVLELAMPMKIVAGLTLRVVYHATVLNVTPQAAANFKLWKVLS